MIHGIQTQDWFRISMYFRRDIKCSDRIRKKYTALCTTIFAIIFYGCHIRTQTNPRKQYSPLPEKNPFKYWKHFNSVCTFRIILPNIFYQPQLILSLPFLLNPLKVVYPFPNLPQYCTQRKQQTKWEKRK